VLQTPCEMPHASTLPGTIRFRNVCVVLMAAAGLFAHVLRTRHHGKTHMASAAGASRQTLVSYSYFESDAVQRDNFALWLKVGWGWNSTFERPHHSTAVIIVSGSECTPCHAAISAMTQIPTEDLPYNITRGYTDQVNLNTCPPLTMLQKALIVMDIQLTAASLLPTGHQHPLPPK